VIALAAGMVGLCALCALVIVASLFVPKPPVAPDAGALLPARTVAIASTAPDVVMAATASQDAAVARLALDASAPSATVVAVAPRDASVADVDPVFAAMSDREHLAAARAAMADGYEREERVGGELDLARQHLAAVPPTSHQRARADALLHEIEGRETRAQAMLAASAALEHQQQADRVTRGEEPARLPNGSLFEVNRHMREVLSDPGSYDPLGCGPVRPQGPHWVATCSFRARNELGLLGLNVWNYRIQAGRVVEAGPVTRP